jgi:hypothetical protein
MMPQKQLSLAEIYSDCKSYFENDKPHFLSLLAILQHEFRKHLYVYIIFALG